MSEKPKGFLSQPSYWIGLIATMFVWFLMALLFS